MNETKPMAIAFDTTKRHIVAYEEKGGKKYSYEFGGEWNPVATLIPGSK